MKRLYRALLRVLWRDYRAFDIMVNAIRQTRQTLRNELVSYWYAPTHRDAEPTIDDLDTRVDYVRFLLEQLHAQSETYLKHDAEHLLGFERVLYPHLNDLREYAQCAQTYQVKVVRDIDTIYTALSKIRTLEKELEASHAIGVVVKDRMNVR